MARLLTLALFLGASPAWAAPFLAPTPVPLVAAPVLPVAPRLAVPGAGPLALPALAPVPRLALPALPATLPAQKDFRRPADMPFSRRAAAGGSASRTEGPYDFLRPSIRAHAARLAEIVAIAAETETGAKVLDRAAAALARNGRSVPVSFMALGNNLGEFDYIDGSLRMHRRYLSGDPRLAAETLVHELVHVAQENEGALADALEREIEAHMIGRAFLQELGLEPKNSFSHALERELRRGAEAAAAWLSTQLPGTIRLEGRAWADVVDDLEDVVDELEMREGRSRRAQRQLERARAELRMAHTARGRKAAQELTRRAWTLLRAASAESQ